MAGIILKQATANLTSDGDATGYATVASNADFYAGAQLFISDGNSASQLCQVTDLVGTTKIGLRFINVDGRLNPPQYGIKSDLSAYTVAQGARLDLFSQVVDEYNNKKQL